MNVDAANTFIFIQQNARTQRKILWIFFSFNLDHAHKHKQRWRRNNINVICLRKVIYSAKANDDNNNSNNDNKYK